MQKSSSRKHISQLFKTNIANISYFFYLLSFPFIPSCPPADYLLRRLLTMLEQIVILQFVYIVSSTAEVDSLDIFSQDRHFICILH